MRTGLASQNKFHVYDELFNPYQEVDIAKNMLWNGCGALITRTWKSRADKPKKL